MRTAGRAARRRRRSSPTAGRTASWLDQLTDDGRAHRRAARPARRRGRRRHARPAAAPRRARRPRPAARSSPTRSPTRAARRRATDLTNVLHHRITDGGTASTRSATPTPTGSRASTTRTGSDYLDRARRRRRRSARDELGRGPPTSRRSGRSRRSARSPTTRRSARRGSARAGAVAAYRELRGHDDDRPTRSAPPPKAGQVEAYAAWRAAWRALGRPEVDRAELRDVRRPAAGARPRLRAGDRPGRPATSPTNSPAPARPPPTTARPPPCAAPRPTPPPTTPSAPGCTRRPPRPRPWPRPSTSAPPSCEVRSTTPAPLARPHRRHPRRRRTGARPSSPRHARGRRGPEARGHRRGMARARTTRRRRRGRAPRDHRARLDEHDDETSAVDDAAASPSRRHPRGRRGRTAPGARGRRARALRRRDRRARSAAPQRRPRRDRGPRRGRRRARGRRDARAAARPLARRRPDRRPTGGSTTTARARTRRAVVSAVSPASRSAISQRWRRRAPPRPPQRRHGCPRHQPGRCSHEVRPADVELLRGEVLRLDQLLVGADAAGRSPAMRGLRAAGARSCTTAPASHSAGHGDAAGVPVGDAAPVLLAVEPLRRGPERAELRPRHPEVRRPGRGRCPSRSPPRHSGVTAAPTMRSDPSRLRGRRIRCGSSSRSGPRGPRNCRWTRLRRGGPVGP